MHFPTFTVATTNIFPLSNSTKGGQLVTEYNLRAREMVGTNPDIKYEVGPSYVHSMEDFQVTLLSSMEADDFDPTDTYTIGSYVTYNSATYVCIEAVATPGPFDSSKWMVVSSASCIIQVAPGRAVINGHYIQSLAPMIVDLALANAQLAKNYEEPLLGELCIGIRAYYSTESTMAGSMLIENEDNTYTGVQLVIEKKENFSTPSDSPTDRSAVTADIKLADFIYINGVVASIVQNEGKLSYLDATRIADVEKLLDDNFVSKTNLDADKLYTFSGIGAYTDKSTWCDSTGSLMVWDSDPRKVTDNPNEEIKEATFLSTTDGYVHLAVPHQQLDYGEERGVYYAVRDIKLPKANYLSGTPGTVDSQYTQVIKNLAEKLGGLKQSPAGNMILWLDTKDSDYVMPTIPANYNNGDYIFVREDFTARMSEDEGAAPSTMYKVLPGVVANIDYSATLPTGVRLGETAIGLWAGDNPDVTVNDLKHLADFYDTSINYTPTGAHQYAAYNGGLYKCKSATSGEWDPSKWDRILNEDATTLFGFNTFRGTLNADYFELDWHNDDDTVITPLYYKVTGSGPRTWSEYILVTGGVPLASTIQAGGFYNVDSTATDNGYVTLDENGRLKLVDYSLLRSGTLAYQLGEDFTLPSNITSDQVQANLDEYVNNRVAFPLEPQITSTSSLINVYITLPEEENATVINIYNIDSRFGTAVYLHFLGKANANTIVNIVDCEKIRIDSNIAGTPIINVVRSCIYYDANVFNYIRVCDTLNRRTSGFTGFIDITLWYDKFTDTDADVEVNGMEVIQPNVANVAQDITFWNEANPNDNHYSSALRSITFSGEGNIIGCSLYVSNGSTATNVTSGRSIIGGDFILPQGSDLVYPIRCLTNSLKVTGSFTTAYAANNQQQWVVMATNFTAVTGTYSTSNDTASTGSIAFDTITDLLRSENMTADVKTIEAWAPGNYHIFYGGTTI